jgi:hypothetical protein
MILKYYKKLFFLLSIIVFFLLLSIKVNTKYDYIKSYYFFNYQVDNFTLKTNLDFNYFMENFRNLHGKYGYGIIIMSEIEAKINDSANIITITQLYKNENLKEMHTYINHSLLTKFDFNYKFKKMNYSYFLRHIIFLLIFLSISIVLLFNFFIKK